MILKNRGRKSFSYETKASMSFIPIRRMTLSFLIMKRMVIIMWIRVYPNWQTNFDSKKWLEDKHFLQNQSVNVIYPNEQNKLIMVPNHENEGVITWISICPNWKKNFDSKKWSEEKLFLWNQSINVIYPNEKNEFIIPNHGKKGDYYVNPYLSKLKNKLWF